MDHDPSCLRKKERRGRRVQPRPLEGGGDGPPSQSKLGGKVDNRVERVVHLAIQKERRGHGIKYSNAIKKNKVKQSRVE